MQETVARPNQHDSALEARVDDLLGHMTLAEKVGQLVQITPSAPIDPQEMVERMKQAEAAGLPIQSVFQPRPDLEDLIRAGSIGSIFATPDVQLINRCQRVAVEDGRLGIPLIVGNDVIPRIPDHLPDSARGVLYLEPGIA
jgi:beta-glucosidase